MSEAYSDFDSRKPIAMEQEIDRLVYELYSQKRKPNVNHGQPSSPNTPHYDARTFCNGLINSAHSSPHVSHKCWSCGVRVASTVRRTHIRRNV